MFDIGFKGCLLFVICRLHHYLQKRNKEDLAQMLEIKIVWQNESLI